MLFMVIERFRNGDGVAVYRRFQDKGRMMPEGLIYIDISPGSRYSYLAASQISRIEATTGCRFDWHPVQGSEIRALRGQDPFAGEPISGQYDWSYRERDAGMWADYYGIPFSRAPESRARLRLARKSRRRRKLLGAVASYGWALCSAAYGSSQWPIDREVCLSLAQQVGLAPSELDRLLDSPAPQELLFRTAREAHERGAFGVPTLFLGERMYWGNDRLVLLEHALHQLSA